MKIHAREGGAGGHQDVWLNIYSIDEVVQLPPRRAKDAHGNFIRPKQGEPADSDGWLVVPQIEVGVHATHRGLGASAGGPVVHASYTMDGEPAAFVAQLEELIACDRAEPAEDDSLTINDRGVWLPGESYAFLDMVGHPDDVSKKLLAVAPSKSTSSLVLKNTEFWCGFPAGAG